MSDQEYTGPENYQPDTFPTPAQVAEYDPRNAVSHEQLITQLLELQSNQDELRIEVSRFFKIPDISEAHEIDRLDVLAAKLEETNVRMQSLADGINQIGTMMNHVMQMAQGIAQQFSAGGPAALLGMLGGNKNG